MKMTVADIMTTNLVKLTPDATLGDAHRITRDRGIRHLPVVDQLSGKLMALVTQKALIAKVVKSIALYGGQNLLEQENNTNIMEVAVTDFRSVKKDDLLTDRWPLFFG